MNIRTKRKGSALLFVSTLAGLLLIAAFAACVNAVSNVKVTDDEKLRSKLEFACESGLNRARRKIESSFNNNNLNVLEPVIVFQGPDADETGLSPEEKAYDDETFVDADTNYYAFTINNGGEDSNIKVRYSISNGRDNETGWLRSSDKTTNKMRVEAVAFIPGKGWIGMDEDVYAQRTALFNYQIFFENDLEVLPGVNFTLRGPIHTNQNMYLNSDATMTIYSNKLSSAGNIYRGRLDSNDVNGTVKISSFNENGSLVTMAQNNDSRNNNWINIATNNWRGTVKDQSLGETRQEAPALKSFEPGGYYDTNSGINIHVNAGTTTTYTVRYGGTTHTYTSAQLNSALKEANVNDYREYPSGSKPVKTTEVDINKLKTALNYFPANGLIYMTRDDAVADKDNDPYTPDSHRVVSGFKLVNDSTLPSATTFVSNLPVYVKGDYNKHTSNNPNIDTWKPSAVIADSITLLSNSWSNTKNAAVTATNTEYNMVFISGNVPTKVGQYSGGLENFPRLLENWSGKNLNITGGFIQLYRSKYSTGIWNYGTYYQAPARNWQYEPRFSNLNNLPPDFVNMFPSTSINVVSTGWKLIDKNDSDIYNSDNQE